ncbi:hypothetical protein BKA69DRAFT_1052369 [Paraphysoderma sedebokerense]|nr:hypothetical protein BKA69DRAFT_1052369 [Paraphysoderma sedebokerense]
MECSSGAGRVGCNIPHSAHWAFHFRFPPLIALHSYSHSIPSLSLSLSLLCALTHSHSLSQMPSSLTLHRHLSLTLALSLALTLTSTLTPALASSSTSTPAPLSLDRIAHPCQNLSSLPNQCAFVRANCSAEYEGFLNYLSFYYCSTISFRFLALLSMVSLL